MINLLLPKEKEKILLKLKKRIITILWFLVLFFLVCCILVLFSVKFYTQKQIQSQEIILQTIRKEFETSEVQGLQKEISSVNLKLVQLNNFYKSKIYITEVLERVSDTLPQGTYLTSLSVIPFDIGGKFFFKVDLSGFSQSREVLFELKENLEEEDIFKEIYFPPSNWIKSTDIDFSVTFKAI